MSKPCYHCKDREIYCHDDCMFYQEYTKELEKKKEYFKEGKAYSSYVAHAVQRMKGINV